MGRQQAKKATHSYCPVSHSQVLICTARIMTVKEADKSISFSGVPDEDVEGLQEDDEFFYNSDSDDASDRSSGEEREPAAKRLYHDFSDRESNAGEQSFSGEAAKGDVADAHQVYIAVKIQDLRNGGCGCAAKNHNADLVLMSLKI